MILIWTSGVLQCYLFIYLLQSAYMTRHCWAFELTSAFLAIVRACIQITKTGIVKLIIERWTSRSMEVKASSILHHLSACQQKLQWNENKTKTHKIKFQISPLVKMLIMLMLLHHSRPGPRFLMSFWILILSISSSFCHWIDFRSLKLILRRSIRS
jgi:hypothetical protein